MTNSTTPNSAAATSAPLFPASKAHIRLNIEWLRTQGAQLKPSPFKVYAALLARLGKNPTAWPSHALLALDTGLSVPTVKRALNSLKESGCLGWNARFEPTDRGKMRRTSNDYFLTPQVKNEPCQGIKSKPCPGSKVSDKTVTREVVTPQTNNSEAAATLAPVVVESAIKSPVLETQTPLHSPDEIEAWQKMLVAARLSKDDAARYAGPDVPRILAWWDTVDKLKMRGIGLLINKLKDPSSLPLPEVAALAPRREKPDAPALTIEEQRTWARAHIEACLSALSPAFRVALERDMAGKKLSQQVEYLRQNALRDWEQAERDLAGQSFKALH